jgi:hypothetical protein
MRRLIVLAVVCTSLAFLTWTRAADREAKSPAKPTASPPAKADEPLAAKLFRRVDFKGYDDPKMTLGEALEDLGKKYGLSFDLKETAFKFENLQDVEKTEIASPNAIPPMKNVRLDTVLRKVLSRIPSPSGADFLVRRDVVEITTGTFIRAEVWGAVEDGPFLPVVQVLADRRPLDETLKELAEQSGYNILLDVRAGENGKTPVTAELYNTPLDTAVGLLAAMARLRPVRVDNVLFVTNAETAEALEKAKPKKPVNQTGFSWMPWGPGGTMIPLPEN